MQAIKFGTCLLDVIEEAKLAPIPGRLQQLFLKACETAGIGPWRIIEGSRYGLDPRTVSNYLVALGFPSLLVRADDQFWYPHDEPIGETAILIDAEDNHATQARLVAVQHGDRIRVYGHDLNASAKCCYGDAPALGSSRARRSGRSRAPMVPRGPRQPRARASGLPRARNLARLPRPNARARGSGIRTRRVVRSASVPAAISSSGSSRNSIPYHYSGVETIGTITKTGLILPVAACSPVLFPMGYRVMNTFARYRFTRLKFSFEPLMGTGTPGSVWLAFSPTPFTEPIAFQDVSTAASVANGSIWSHTSVDVRYEPTQRWLLNYSTSVWDYKGPDYNLGVLYANVVGDPGDGAVGVLKVDYSVVLVDRARTLPNPAGPSALLAQLALLGQQVQQVDSDHRALPAPLERPAPLAPRASLDLPEPQELKE